MMRQYELVERVMSYNKKADEALLNKAYVYAMQKHGTQLRASGDPYFSHPLEVAAILTELKVDDSTIVIALLHDTIEDTDATRKEIDELFGERIGELVEGLTKLKRLDLVSKKAERGENLRRLLLAVSDDIRVLLVKLADRLHNMRTLHHVKPEKRARVSEETLEIYAPLAGRIGMQTMRSELEELSFKYMDPDAYKSVSERLEKLATKNRGLLEKITSSLRKKLKDSGIKAKVLSRQKKAFSIFRKMEEKNLAFEQLSDIFAFRIQVNSVDDCYRALGLVHTSWTLVPGRFKDYISAPKQNRYQSIHTTVIGPSSERVELQIRTGQMDDVAEYGVAAHSFYKDKEKGISNENDAYSSLRKTIEQLADSANPEDFLEHTKLELFLDQVFCFTPKGRVISLPRGATPIDFAYAVHTDVGNRCVGCKINGVIMPVISELRNGNEVDIILSPDQTPPAAWEDFVVTGKARAAIRKASREAMRLQYSGIGVRILERLFKEREKPFSRDMLEFILPRLARESVDGVCAEVGRGELKAEDVFTAVHPNYQEQRATAKTPPKDGWLGLRERAGLSLRLPSWRGRASKKRPDNQPSVPIRGMQENMAVSFAPGVGAVPGDRIVGILEPGEGITIYPIQSSLLTEFESQVDKWVDVRWDIDDLSDERFPATIRLSALNEPGALGTISLIIGDEDCNIQNLVMTAKAKDFTEMVIDLEVWNLDHLDRIMNHLSSQSVVRSIVRVTA